MPAQPTFHNAASAGALLGISGERVRQLFQNGQLPVTAWLNGEKPLVDSQTLMRFAQQRAAKAAPKP